MLADARPARAEAPPWLIAGSASESLVGGPQFTPVVLAARLDVLVRFSRSWMLGGLADYAFLASEGETLGDSAALTTTSSFHFFHGMIETRFVGRPLDIERLVPPQSTVSQPWLAFSAGVGGADANCEQGCNARTSTTTSVVAGPAFGFHAGGDFQMEGSFWFELGGGVTLEDYFGSQADVARVAGLWLELGVSVGLRFDGPRAQE
jgi:hypothetical protein